MRVARSAGWVVRQRPAKLAPLLGDREWWVRAAAKDALRDLAPRSLAALEGALDDEDEFARNGAAEVLQDIGVVDDLIDSGSDPALLGKILVAGGLRLRTTALQREAGREAAGHKDEAVEAA